MEVAELIATGDPDGKLRDDVRRWGGSATHYKDIMQHQKLAKDVVDTGLKWMEKMPLHTGLPARGARHVWSKFAGVMSSIYEFGDEAPKAYGYRLNRAMIDAKLPSLSEEQKNEFAAEYVRYTMFDYDQVPPIVKKIRDFSPLGGGFLSWASLTFTTAYHAMRLAAKTFHLETRQHGFDTIRDFDPSNQSHVRRATASFLLPQNFATSMTSAKMTGFSVAMMLPMVYSKAMIAAGGFMMGSLFGDDDEDISARLITDNYRKASLLNSGEVKEHMSNLLPEYYANVSKGIVDINDKQNLEFINTSRITNYGNFAEAMSIITDPDLSVTESAGGAFETLFGDYYNQGFGLQFAEQIKNNEDRFGNAIFTEGDSLPRDVFNFSEYLYNNILRNSTFRAAEHVYQSAVNDEEFDRLNGRPISASNTVLELSGFKKVEFDAEKEFFGRLYDIDKELDASKKEMNSRLLKRNVLSDREMETEVLRAVSVHQDKMRDIKVKNELIIILYRLV